jgi:two-component system, LuxR family, sensor kinase FixL
MADSGQSNTPPTSAAGIADEAALLRAILDTAVDGIITIDERAIVQSFNRGAERLFGHRADEVIGRNVNLLMPEPYHREHDRYMHNYLTTGVKKIIGIGREVLGLRKDGTIFPMDLAVSEVKLGDRRLFTGIVHDLTERTMLEKQVLEISDSEKRRIGQDLHDGLGQTLTGIGFKSKALENKLAKQNLPEAQTARQLAELVTQAISQSRAIARGLQPVSVERTGLMAALSDLASQLSEIFRIECAFDCPQQVPIRDLSVALHLYRIAQEAANNAIKHGRATRVSISLTRGADKVRLAVEDDGCGFSRGSLAHSSSSGLLIMRYRASLVGGALSIESQPGRGTVVSCIVSEDLWGTAQQVGAGAGAAHV